MQRKRGMGGSKRDGRDSRDSKDKNYQPAPSASNSSSSSRSLRSLVSLRSSSSTTASRCRKIIPKGGSVRLSECARPFLGISSDWTPPSLPRPLPPYSSASLLRTSRQKP